MTLSQARALRHPTATRSVESKPRSTYSNWRANPRTFDVSLVLITWSKDSHLPRYLLSLTNAIRARINSHSFIHFSSCSPAFSFFFLSFVLYVTFWCDDLWLKHDPDNPDLPLFDLQASLILWSQRWSLYFVLLMTSQLFISPPSYCFDLPILSSSE